MGVAAKRPQSLLWRESQEKLSQFEVVRVGRRLHIRLIPHQVSLSLRTAV